MGSWERVLKSTGQPATSALSAHRFPFSLSRSLSLSRVGFLCWRRRLGERAAHLHQVFAAPFAGDEHPPGC
ncbi:hypothetical protein U9M48_012244 [Paspalum notatum var. saurae]|uniref:Uncharacterized protein n=1 Tax=Paspalum notatum var. saurae TaxID=547442 RepID=A0AAQ3SXX2_PASNO